MKSAQDLLHEAYCIRDVLAIKHPDLGPVLRQIRIEISTRMTEAAGKAKCQSKIVKLSLPFYADETNFTEDFYNTVTHEFAHILAPPFWGPTGRKIDHGEAWQAMHIRLGGNGERCHTLEVAEAFKRKVVMTPAACGTCGQSIMLSPIRLKRHNENLALGGRGYRHNKCP